MHKLELTALSLDHGPGQRDEEHDEQHRYRPQPDQQPTDRRGGRWRPVMGEKLCRLAWAAGGGLPQRTGGRLRTTRGALSPLPGLCWGRGSGALGAWRLYRDAIQ